MASESRYWFPAKRHGWGWTWPRRWEGRAVLAALVVLLVVGAAVMPPGKAPLGFVVYALGLGLVTVGICWWKGEPPRWRWSDREP